MPSLLPLYACILVLPMAAQTVVVQPADGAKATETRTVAVAAGKPVRVKNVNGRIKVTGWDKAEVVFTGAFTPASDGRQVKVVLEPRDGGLEVRGEYPKHSHGGPSCDMELKVPRSALASLSSVNGGVELRQVTGKASCSTVNGSILAADLGGGLATETVNGSIDLAQVAGDLSASTVNGRIRLSSQGLDGRVEASTVNGSLRIKGEGAKDVQVSKRRLGATFGNGARHCKLETVNGDISLD